MIKRFLYLGYYIKELDKVKFNKFINHVSQLKNRSKLSILLDMFYSSLKYNISLLEYFHFKFYEINSLQKLTYAGTGFMYEYQLQMNPKSSRIILEDKVMFLKEYGQFVRHKFASLLELANNENLANEILSNNSGKIVLKDSKGQCGNGVVVRKSNELNFNTLLKELEITSNDYVEEFVQQHNHLMDLSPSGLNTIRVITQVNKEGEVDILGCRLRITINSSVDNLAAGNIAAEIDEQTGLVVGPGVYSDITKEDEYFHPITNVKLIGFQVPYWKETIEMVKKAAKINTNNKSIGWDVAITNSGPELIEGNHDWCKLLWQLPMKKGLKPILEKYLN